MGELSDKDKERIEAEELFRESIRERSRHRRIVRLAVLGCALALMAFIALMAGCSFLIISVLAE